MHRPRPWTLRRERSDSPRLADEESLVKDVSPDLGNAEATAMACVFVWGFGGSFAPAVYKQELVRRSMLMPMARVVSAHIGALVAPAAQPF